MVQGQGRWPAPPVKVWSDLRMWIAKLRTIEKQRVLKPNGSETLKNKGSGRICKRTSHVIRKRKASTHFIRIVQKPKEYG